MRSGRPWYQRLIFPKIIPQNCDEWSSLPTGWYNIRFLTILLSLLSQLMAYQFHTACNKSYVKLLVALRHAHAGRNWQTFITLLMTVTRWLHAATHTGLNMMANVTSCKGKYFLNLVCLVKLQGKMVSKLHAKSEPWEIHSFLPGVDFLLLLFLFFFFFFLLLQRKTKQAESYW